MATANPRSQFRIAPLTGAVVGFLLTAALSAVFYLGQRLWGLPFVPFDVFEWVTGRLPGPVVTRGIEAVVTLIRTLGLGSTDVAAKAIEQLMAIAGLMLAGAAAGAVLVSIRNRPGGRWKRAGAVVGGLAGILIVLGGVSLDGGASAAPVLSFVWVLAACLIWGVALDWADRRLRDLPASAGGAPAAESWTVDRLDRRRFLIRLGGAAATITVSGTVIGMLVGRRQPEETSGGPRVPGMSSDPATRWSASHALPNAGATVLPAPGTRPEFTPLDDHYRIDINLLPPVIREETWALEIRGLVNKPLRMTLAELRDNFRPMHQFVTLACISNEIAGDLIGTTRWTGVSLRRLLPYLGLRPAATHLKILSADGFYEVVSLETITADERVMLTYAWDGVPLPTRHGFPLRIYIPDRYGMKQPKWITAIEAIGRPEDGYWVVRGWDSPARMQATSVIDTVALDPVITGSDGRRLVPIGGIAHAGARGISKVEVRVDDGDWRAAQLRTPLSGTTWVIWRYDWPFEPGAHTFTVRCTDGAGAPQITEPSPPHPAGATGLHRKRAGG